MPASGRGRVRLPWMRSEISCTASLPGDTLRGTRYSGALMFPFYIKRPDFQEPDVPIYYLLAGNGLFLIKRNAIFASCTRVQGLPWLDAQDEGYRLTCPRLPAW